MVRPLSPHRRGTLHLWILAVSSTMAILWWSLRQSSVPAVTEPCTSQALAAQASHQTDGAPVLDRGGSTRRLRPTTQQSGDDQDSVLGHSWVMSRDYLRSSEVGITHCALQGVVQGRGQHFMIHLWMRAELLTSVDGGSHTLFVKGFAVSESLDTSEHKLAQLSNAGPYQALRFINLRYGTCCMEQESLRSGSWSPCQTL